MMSFDSQTWTLSATSSGWVGVEVRGRQDGFGERNYMAEPILVTIKFPLPSL